MDAIDDGGVSGLKKYTTPKRVQAWFLLRSRDNWKKKYRSLWCETKRLKNRVSDVVKSRDHWKERVKSLEAENAALLGQAAEKKE